MDCRSEVCLALSEEADQLFQINIKMIPALKDFVKGAENSSDRRYYWCDIKWYEGYEEVDSVNSFMNFLEETDYDHYGFIRVGEQMGDIEERGDPAQYELYVSRSISW